MAEEHEKTEPVRSIWPWLAAAGVIVLMIFALRSQGRIWWCKWGDIALYVHQAWNSTHTSQHLFDPYSFTHVLHGVLFFWLAGLLFYKLSLNWQFLIAIAAEAGWEVLENSAYIIERYRQNTASLDYFGDSVMNSVGDVAACAVGFCVAAAVGKWRSLIFFFVVELVLLLWIRDGLLLNILMLIYPLDAVKSWQTG